MKKAIAVFLCIMLTTGMISGCAGREQGADSSGENTAAEENKEDQDAQTEEGQDTEEEARRGREEKRRAGSAGD